MRTLKSNLRRNRPINLSVDKQKRTGSHFTPDALGDLLSDRLITASSNRYPQTVMDPSCGDGALLAAFIRRASASMLANITFRGVEADEDSFRELAKRFDETPAKVDLVQGDFLDFSGDDTMFGQRLRVPQADVIIANPPYVRTQVLGAKRAQQLGQDFGLTGRVDLYHVFLVAMTRALAPGGLLGVITSNRFLTTEGGESVRQFLADNYDLLEVLDLGDTKLFSAAVLPAIVIARRKSNGLRSESSPSRFVRIYERHEAGTVKSKTVKDVYAILQKPASGYFHAEGRPFTVTTGRLLLPDDHAEPWRMVTSSQQDWLDVVDRNSEASFGEVASIRVGVKTTADAVFIRNDWETLPAEIRPESKYLRPIVSQEQSAKWQCEPTGALRRILYTHEVRDGKRKPIDFPEPSACWKYLLANRQRLESRSYVIEAGRRWYEIWVPQDPPAWAQPKIVFPDISPGPRFFLDREGTIVDGNCYWITLNVPDEDLLLLMLGVANSTIVEKYHDLRFQNKLYAGRKRYLTQYVQHYPLPKRAHKASAQIISIVRRLTSESLETDLVNQLQTELDIQVAAAFGLTDQHISQD